MKTRRFMALLLSALLPLGGALAQSPFDYTVADKLKLQLDAGSGFSGTLTLESAAVAGRESEAIVTNAPVVLDVGYLNVRANEARQIGAEKRLTLSLAEGGESQSPLLEASVQGGALYLKSALLGDDWLKLGGELLSSAQGGLPALSALLPALFAPSALGGKELETLLTPYLTKLDLWLEGYRQQTELGKTESGDSTMTFRYRIAPMAIKSQLKQLVMDAMYDPALLEAVQPLLPEGMAERYLEPKLLSYYFSAIDDLPLTGEMAISRTMSLRGETLRLEIGLPLYDQAAGAITVGYLRAVGDGDIPAAQEISLQSEREKIAIRYQGYDTMTDTAVYQGTLLVQPMEGSARPSVAAAFRLTHHVTESTEAEVTDVMTHELTLRIEPPTDEPEQPLQDAVQPADFAPMEAHVTANFRSRQANDAATYLDAVATLTGEDLPQTITLTLAGRSIKPWTPSAMEPSTARPLSELTSEEQAALLLGAGVKASSLLLPLITLPAALLPAQP